MCIGYQVKPFQIKIEADVSFEEAIFPNPMPFAAVGLMPSLTQLMHGSIDGQLSRSQYDLGGSNDQGLCSLS